MVEFIIRHIFAQHIYSSSQPFSHVWWLSWFLRKSVACRIVAYTFDDALLVTAYLCWLNLLTCTMLASKHFWDFSVLYCFRMNFIFFWLNDTRYMLSSYISLDSKKCHDNKQTFLLSKTSGVQHDIVSQVVRPTKHIYQVCRSLYSWSQRICLVRICFPPGCCLHVRYYFVWCDWCLQLEWPHQMSYLVISSLKGLSSSWL